MLSLKVVKLMMGPIQEPGPPFLSSEAVKDKRPLDSLRSLEAGDQRKMGIKSLLCMLGLHDDSWIITITFMNFDIL